MIKVAKDITGNTNLIRKDTKEFSIESLREIMPKGYKGYINEELVNKLNHWDEEDDKDRTEWYKENFCTYLGVIEGTNISLDRYIQAIKYCSLRLLGYGKLESWKRTFPEKVDRLVKGILAEGYDSVAEGEGAERLRMRCKDFSDAYNTTRLVVAIMGQSLVPSYIVNAPYYQEAINKLVEIIRDDHIKNGMTKVKACEAILNATKQPEVVENNVNVNFGVGVSNSAMDELREVTNKLALTLKEQVECKGKNLRELTDIELVRGDDWNEQQQ